MAASDVEMSEDSDQGVCDSSKSCGYLLLMMVRI